MPTRTVANGGGNYNATGTWVEGAVPTSLDDVVFTATSGQLTVNVTSACKTITFANYTNTVTFNAGLNVSGNINLGTGGYTVAGSASFGLTSAATGTITSNGTQWGGGYQSISGVTVTLADNFTVLGNAFLNGGTMNGFALIFKGSSISNGVTTNFAGTTGISLQPTTSCSIGNTSTGIFANSGITFQSGTINIGTNFRYGSGTLTYVGGTVNTTGSTVTISTGTVLNTNGSSSSSPSTSSSTGINFNNLILGGTITLTSHLCVVGTLNLSTSLTLNGAFITYVSGDMTISATNSSGTASINLVGTGSQTWSGNFVMGNSLTINKPSGAFIISGSVQFGNSKTLTYTTSGSVTNTGSTLFLQTSTIDTSGMTWNSIATLNSTTTTVTLSSNLNLSGTLSLNCLAATTTWNGFTIVCSGSVASSVTSGLINGTTLLKMTGTGNFGQGSATTGALRLSVTFDSTCVVSILGSINYNTGTMTTVAGCSVSVVGGTLSSVSLATTFNTPHITWANVTIGAANTVTYTFSNHFYCSGTLSIGAGIFNTTLTSVGGSAIYCSGSLTSPLTSGSISGASIHLTGTGTFTMTGISSGSIRTNLYFDSTCVITISGTIGHNTGSIISASGCSVTVSSGSVLTSTLATTYDCPHINWWHVNWNVTISLTSDFYVYGTLTTATGNVCAINGAGNIHIYGNLTHGNGGVTSGNSDIYFDGTGSWNGGNQILRNNVIFSVGCNITLSATVKYDTGTITYVGGTITNTGSTLTMVASTTLNTSGMTWNNVSFGGTTNYTLSSNLNCVNLTFVTGGVSVSILGGYNINVSGDFNCNNTATWNCGGGSTIVFTGTGTWSHSTTGKCTASVTFNTSGTITLGSNIYINGTTFTYVSGTINTSGNTLTTQGNPAFNTNGMSWNNITIDGVGSTNTVTLNSLLSINGTLTVGVNTTTTTFAGTGGFTAANFTCVTAGRGITFTTGVTYTVTNSLIITGTSGAKISFTSTSTGALFNYLGTNANQAVTNCNATFINSNGGRTIYTSAGALSNTFNWNVGTPPLGSGFFNWFFS